MARRGRGVYFTGVAALQEKLRKNATMEDVKNVVKMNTEELQKKMMRDAPVDTGFLKRSIVFELSSNGLTGRVTPEAEYAPYLIYGTRFNAKQDFFRPNLKSQSKQFKEDMDRLVE